MPSRKQFPARLLIDYAFYQTAIRSGVFDLLHKLMYINYRSLDWKRDHNKMCKKNFDIILKEKEEGEERDELEACLKASFTPLYSPASILEIDDEVERNIKFAIDLASKTPYKTVILTTEQKKEKYLSNSHYSNVKSILIKSDAEAILLINDFYQKAIEE